MQDKDKEIDSYPFGLIVIPVFYGFRTLWSLLGVGQQYILFGFILPVTYSTIVVVIETAVLMFLTIGIFKRQARAVKVLIVYNIFVIADTLVTLIFIKKEKLLTILENAAQLEQFANFNLFMGLILFIILRYIMARKEYFVN